MQSEDNGCYKSYNALNKKQLKNILSDIRRDFFLKVALFSFVLVAFGLNETGLMPVFAAVLGLMFFSSKSRFLYTTLKNYPIEMKLINLWLIWTFFTGIFVSTNVDFFLEGFLSLCFMILVLNLLYIIISVDQRLISYVFLGIFFAAAIQIAGIKLGFQTEDVLDKERQYGLTNNPNSYGLKMVYSSIPLLVFLKYKKFKINLSVILAIMFLTLYLNEAFASGSRKAVIGFAFWAVGFLVVYAMNKNRKINIFKGVIILAGLALLLYFVAPIILEGTIVQDRFLMGEERGGVEGDIRYQMYIFGFDIFAQHPFLGIGLNNYRELFFTGQYSHSDYIESLASTGIFGFILYQSFFIVPLIKSIRLSKLVAQKNTRFFLLFSSLSVLCIKFIGTGVILYTSPSVMLMMACIIGFINNVAAKTKDQSFQNSQNSFRRLNTGKQLLH